MVTDKRKPAVAAVEGILEGEEAEAVVPDSSQRLVVLHALQLLSGEPYRDHEKHQYL